MDVVSSERDRERVRMVRLDGVDVAVDIALDDRGAHVDLGVDDGVLSDDQDIVAVDRAGEFPVDSDDAFEAQFAFEVATRSEQRVHVFLAGRHVLDSA